MKKNLKIMKIEDLNYLLNKVILGYIYVHFDKSVSCATYFFKENIKESIYTYVKVYYPKDLVDDDLLIPILENKVSFSENKINAYIESIDDIFKKYKMYVDLQ